MNAVRNVERQFRDGVAVDGHGGLSAHGEFQFRPRKDAAGMQSVHHVRLVLHDLDDSANLIVSAAPGGSSGIEQIGVRLADRKCLFTEFGQTRDRVAVGGRPAGGRAA